MTPLLISTLALLALYGLYFAARVARSAVAPRTFLDAGQSLPGWTLMFLLPGLVLAGLGIERQLGLVARFGLQASHVGVGVVLVALSALAVWNRLWGVTRATGLSTPGAALGRYYDSTALRVVMMGMALIFALPFAADSLSNTARLLEGMTGGSIPRVAGIWLFAFALAAPAIVGGWRATGLTLAMQAVLIALLLPAIALFAELTLPGPGFPARPFAVAEGVLWDRIPGVLQNAAGLGKSVPPGGIFTTVGIVSAIVALLGLVLSPAALYLAQTTAPGRTLGVSAVWLTAGTMAGLLLLAVPVLAARMPEGPVALTEQLYTIAPFAGVALPLMLITGALLIVSLFVTGGVLLLTRELLLTFLLPGLTDRGARLTARIALGFGFFTMALMASFAPFASAVVASVALPLSVQMLPALLGLTFARWISRGAVLAGLALGSLIVVMTEPLGLILFEALFVELPWGRWPLTIHSALWGLVFNLALVLLASWATMRLPDRFARAGLHDAMAEQLPLNTSGRGLLWSLGLLWGFLAYGPGAILGNTFFSQPIFSKVEAQLGIPSLWVWQILFWLLGVVLVWWLAYRVGLGRLSADGIRPFALGEEEHRRTPDWLAAGLDRVIARPGRAANSNRREGEKTRRQSRTF